MWTTAPEDNTLPGVETTAPPPPSPHQQLPAGAEQTRLPLRGYSLLPFRVSLLGLHPRLFPIHRLHRRHSSNCVFARMLPRPCRPRRIPALLFMPSVFLSQQPTPPLGKILRVAAIFGVHATNCANGTAERRRRSRRLQLGARYQRFPPPPGQLTGTGRRLPGLFTAAAEQCRECGRGR